MATVAAATYNNTNALVLFTDNLQTPAQQGFFMPELQAEKTCPTIYLLAKANVIRMEDLTAAMSQALAEQRSVESVLQAQGLLSEAMMKNAVEAQRFVQTNTATDSLVLEALSISIRKGIAFSIGLMYLGWGW